MSAVQRRYPSHSHLLQTQTSAGDANKSHTWLFNSRWSPFDNFSSQEQVTAKYKQMQPGISHSAVFTWRFRSLLLSQIPSVLCQSEQRSKRCCGYTGEIGRCCNMHDGSSRKCFKIITSSDCARDIACSSVSSDNNFHNLLGRVLWKDLRTRWL